MNFEFLTNMIKGWGRSGRSELSKNAHEVAENIVGRWDAPTQVPSNVLENVRKADRSIVESLGAVFDEALGKWVVPKGMDNAKFQFWWPLIPSDCVDTSVRWRKTKDGREIDGYVLPQDMAKGMDSSALYLMYTLPVFGLLGWALSLIHPALGAVAYAITIPMLATIIQSEGFGEGLKVCALTLIAPIVLVNMNLPIMLILYGIGIGLILIPIFVWLFDSDAGRNQVIGGKMEHIKVGIKYLFFIAAYEFGATILVGHFHFLAPGLQFGLAALYPCIHSNGNFMSRGIELHAQGNTANAGRMGKMANNHINARLKQAQNVVKDKSPIFDLGEAQGYLTAKKYMFSPDAGGRMCMSSHDMSTHGMWYGMTGAGKSTSFMRNIAKSWSESNEGGALYLCGKGTLPSELSGVIDIMVKPGCNLALFDGLDNYDVTLALTSLSLVDAKNAMWKHGADTFITNSAMLTYALHKHELSYLKNAREKIVSIQNAIDWTELQLERVRIKEQDTTDIQSNLDGLKKKVKGWEDVINKHTPRKYTWTPNTLNNINNIIDNPKMLNNSWVGSDQLFDMLEFLGYKADEKRQRDFPETIHPDLSNEGSLLSQAIKYAEVEWPNTGEQRSSFKANVNDMIHPLLQGGSKLVNKQGTSWIMIEKGIDVGQALYGKSVGVDLPDVKYGRAGLIVMALVKQRIYTGVKQRSDMSESEWRAQGQLPVLVMIDECTKLIGEPERELLPRARALGMKCEFATQGFEQFEAEASFTPVQAKSFCNQFQTLGTLKASHQTYQYMMERMGKAQLLNFPQQIMGLDLEGGVQNFVSSTLNDLNHPQRAVMRKLEAQGAGEFVTQTDKQYMDRNHNHHWRGPKGGRRDDNNIQKYIVVPQGGVLETMPVLDEEEFTSLLEEQGMAVVFVNRGGVRRVDIVKMNAVGENDLRKKETA